MVKKVVKIKDYKENKENKQYYLDDDLKEILNELKEEEFKKIEERSDEN